MLNDRGEEKRETERERKRERERELYTKSLGGEAMTSCSTKYIQLSLIKR